MRGLRIRVADVLEMLAEGVLEEEILADFRTWSATTFEQRSSFAAERAAHVVRGVKLWLDAQLGRRARGRVGRA